MNTTISLSGGCDSTAPGRPGKDCPDVSKNKLVLRIPQKYRDDIQSLQQIYDLHEGLVIDMALKILRGICERDYSKIEAYRGLRKFLFRHFGVTLNIYSQKTKQLPGNKKVEVINQIMKENGKL